MPSEKEVQLRSLPRHGGTDGSVPTDVTSPDGLKYLVSVVSRQNDSVDILFANGNLDCEAKFISSRNSAHQSDSCTGWPVVGGVSRGDGVFCLQQLGGNSQDECAGGIFHGSCVHYFAWESCGKGRRKRKCHSDRKCWRTSSRQRRRKFIISVFQSVRKCCSGVTETRAVHHLTSTLAVSLPSPVLMLDETISVWHSSQLYRTRDIPFWNGRSGGH